MKVDVDKLKKLATAPKNRDRDSVALYIKVDLYNEFKKACSPASHGKILEEFMREFVDSYKAKPKDPK